MEWKGGLDIDKEKKTILFIYYLTPMLTNFHSKMEPHFL